MERNLSIDVLKVIMAFFIVGLHGGFLTDINGYLGYVFVNGLSRIGVPIFLLISGYYFYEIKTTEKFIKWIKRLFYLYFIWFIIYTFTLYSGDLSLKKIIISFIIGPYHLWFLVESLFAYIILWNLRKTNIYFLILFGIICGFLGLLLQYDNSYSILDTNYITEKLGNNAYRNALFFCFPFILIGYSINRFSITTKKIKPIYLIIGAFLLFLEINFNYRYCDSSFDILLSLYIFCPILFIMLYRFKILSCNKDLSCYSAGVYLIHKIFYLVPIKPFSNMGNSIYVIFVFCVSIIISFFLIRINKKLKYVI